MTEIGALVSVPPHLGYVALFALVAAESVGVPLPGETALIAAGLLAHEGRLSIVAVIAVAAVAAIVGDNVGFLIGRRGGRALLERPGPLEKHRRQLLERGEPFFERHGAKAVFLGRWIAALRIAAAWLAGINRMRWPVFLRWNALGGVAWAASVGLLSYFVGAQVANAFKDLGLAGLGLAALVLAGYFFLRRRRLARR